jgi:sulfur-oxidizing protein SoxA
MPTAVSIDGPARASFERGRAFYTMRHGQMNLSCAQCHDQNWGKRLYAETISQGHGNAFPAYRLEWQTLGSLQRRIRACLFGIRAEMPRPGAPELTDLELYLAWRAQGLPLEAPGVRR